MVMKDKLVKNHHKGIYFTLRKATLVILASATFAVAIVVPTYIVSNISANKKASIALTEPAVVEPKENDEDVTLTDGDEDSSDENNKEGHYAYEKYIETCK